MSELNWVVWPDSKIEKTAMKLGSAVEKLESVRDEMEKSGFRRNKYELDNVKMTDARALNLLDEMIERLYDELEDPA